MATWADIKAQARRQVHKTFAVRCLYRETVDATAVDLLARIHNKITIGGGANGGYAQIIEGVSSILFSKEELIAKDVIPKQNAFVTFPDYGSNFQLDIRDPNTGPIVEKWSLAGL